jgi:hypothetical protein
MAIDRIAANRWIRTLGVLTVGARRYVGARIVVRAVANKRVRAREHDARKSFESIKLDVIQDDPAKVIQLYPVVLKPCLPHPAPLPEFLATHLFAIDH